jgi:hypothetical protein
MKKLTPHQEANKMLKTFKDFSKCYNIITGQLNILQSRHQMMLTLATLTLTITGFSGPKMAQSNIVSKYGMIIGLIFVLSSIVAILLSTVNLIWFTQFHGNTDEDTLVLLLERRNLRTKMFHLQLFMLVIGLTSYVIAVIGYLYLGV